ncbi:GspE/PulE family protein [Stenotrophomonas oahuensis]|uniref:ATPase, T2SS/T4P/T4SS family n=1 Tax=Stenotrophomonas oahuensis TaxID=3003271 RepID=A0ABY9YW52_9GAMM|nr:ATPase, T2SS/T4P/T4SS family [Stenotrophomonas sp. A5586]WNH54795.1 ATPase, T2SS/T4P/T4SS family [Stenotrophomonas sp. A5586]
MKDTDVVASWGWQNPPSFVVAQAGQVVDVSGDGRRAIEALGLLDAPAREKLGTACPRGEDFVDYALHEAPKLLASAEQIRALVGGVPFYDSLSLLDRHPCMDKPTVLRECKQKDCVVMLIEGKRPVVVFASYQSMMHFKMAGRTARATDAIELGIADEARLVAVGGRDEISAVLGDNTAGAEISAVEVDRVWDSRSGETKEHAEQLELARLLDHAMTARATDISIIPKRDGNYRVFVRRFGNLMKPRTTHTWDAAQAQQIITTLEAKSGANPSNSTYREPRDGALSYRSSSGEVFLRLSFIPLNQRGDTTRRKSVSIRLLPTDEDAIDLAALKLPEQVVAAVRNCVQMPSGFGLVVGPMNSGKSTTLAAALGMHVEYFGTTKKRVSVEDPVERFIPDVIQVEVPPVMQGSRGVVIDDNERFNVILKGSKRHDINVYCAGEVRDAETAKFCVSVASSGHLAFSTLHAKNSILAFDILAKMVPEDMRFQLGESLNVIISQRLVAALCPTCKIKSKPTAEEKKSWQLYMDMEGEKLPLPATIYRAGPGCDACEGQGFIGYRSVCEVLPFTRSVRDAAAGILEGGASAKAARDVMASHRTLTLAASAASYLKSGDIDFRSAVHL